MLRYWRNFWTRAYGKNVRYMQADPAILEQPRSLCEHHAAGCYLCPRGHCIGMLNDRDHPDPNKPKPRTSARCVYGPSRNGAPGVRFNMTLQGANEYYKRQAMANGYSDVRTREMLKEGLAFLYASPTAQDLEPQVELKRQARHG